MPVKSRRAYRIVRKGFVPDAETFVCKICEKEKPIENVTIDHIMPICIGGHPTNEKNFQIVCSKCNSIKGDYWDGKSGIPYNEEEFLEVCEIAEHIRMLMKPLRQRQREWMIGFLRNKEFYNKKLLVNLDG